MKAKFPRILSTQFTVLQVEISTGVLLTIDGNRFLGEGDCYRVFNSLDMAQTFSKQTVNTIPDVECVIQNNTEQIVDIIQNDVYLHELLNKAKKKRESNAWLHRIMRKFKRDGGHQGK
jgi:hypothetical protein